MAIRRLIFFILFTFAMLFSPKLRGKFLSRQIKSLKYMVEDSKDDLTDITTTASNAMINAEKNILDQNEDTLKNIATRKADISSIGIEKTARAIKNGLTKDDIYCKHCGLSIDSDSSFCKHCGKEQ